MIDEIFKQLCSEYGDVLLLKVSNPSWDGGEEHMVNKIKEAKSQLLAEILKGKETFEIPDYEQGILEAIPTQYLTELFNIKEK